MVLNHWPADSWGSWAAWDAGPLSQQRGSAVGVPGKYLGSPQVTEVEKNRVTARLLRGAVSLGRSFK